MTTQQSTAIPIIDPHVDVADIYKCFNLKLNDFFDAHSTAPVTLQQIKDSNIDIIGMTLYYDSSFVTNSYYDGVKEFYDFNQKLISQSNDFHFIQSKRDLDTKPLDKIGVFYSIEGFECLRGPEDFDEFYNLGVRSFGLTWSFENKYASGRESKNDHGLTNLGKKVVKHMNHKSKLIMDVAHLSEQSFKDLSQLWSGMIVSTHSNVRSIHFNNHNLTDFEIQTIVDRNGVVSLLPLNECTGPKGTFEELYRHVDYIASKWGVEYVGFSTDIYPLPEFPFINNAQNITIAKDWADYLLTRLDQPTVTQILHGNWIRVLKASL